MCKTAVISNRVVRLCRVFGGQLVILIQTIKQLYETCKKQSKHLGLQEETRKLGMNYSALYELNSDIVNFRIM